MSEEQIAEMVEKALDLLIEEQPALLDLDVAERAVSHHLAGYIELMVPDRFDVDVEYNRHRADPKRLDLPPREALDRELRATTVFPDIIVHVRGNDADNLLVLEIKKPGEKMAYDQLKLLAFRKELGYRHTAHVVLGRDNDKVVRDVIWVRDDS